MQTVIIGAGIAGLACGRLLTSAGHGVVILDKGRGLGGRTASRRGPEGLRFDHGAPEFDAQSPEFCALVKKAEAAGHLAQWNKGSETSLFVGLPGMTGLAKFLAAGTDVRNRCEVTDIEMHSAVWKVHCAEDVIEADHLVITAPAPQTAALLGPDHPLSVEAKNVRYDPCLTAMLALSGSIAELPPLSATEDDPIARIVREDMKPGRSEQLALTLYASPDWSRANLERDKAAFAADLVQLFCARFGIDDTRIDHLDGHKWRYAQVRNGLDKPFLKDPAKGLHCGGDWCPGGGVEAAWSSGIAIARDILAQ